MPRNRTSKPSADDRVDISHHHYRIIAGRLNGACRAIAYLGRRRLDEVEADTVEDAVDAMKRTLDDHLAALRRERRDTVPTADEYGEALTVLRAELPAPVFAILDTHVKQTDAVATIRDLMRSGAGDREAVIEAYGRLGRRLAALLDFAPDSQELGREYASMQSFAFVETSEDGTSAVLCLRPQVVTALGLSGQARAQQS